MLWNRNRGVWVWVTIAAIALSSAARSNGARERATAGVHAALALLARGQNLPLAAKPGIPELVPRASGRRISALLLSVGIGAWMAILPLLFVAVISPLRTLTALSLPRSLRAPATPIISATYQRPPPQVA